MATSKKKTAPGAEPPAPVTVRALSPIRHDGDDYAEGDELDVQWADAQALVALGAAELVAAKA